MAHVLFNLTECIHDLDRRGADVASTLTFFALASAVQTNYASGSLAAAGRQLSSLKYFSLPPVAEKQLVDNYAGWLGVIFNYQLSKLA